MAYLSNKIGDQIPPDELILLAQIANLGSPLQYLRVNISGNGLEYATLPSIFPGGNSTDIQFNDSGVFGGSDNFTFDKLTNNVKINLGNSASLRLQSGSGQLDAFIQSAFSNGFLSSNGLFNGSAYVYDKTGTASQIQLEGSSGNIYLNTAPSGTGGDPLVWDRRITILNNGNVGIGTDTPWNFTTIKGGGLVIGNNSNVTASGDTSITVGFSDGLGTVSSGENGEIAGGVAQNGGTVQGTQMANLTVGRANGSAANVQNDSVASIVVGDSDAGSSAVATGGTAQFVIAKSGGGSDVEAQADGAMIVVSADTGSIVTTSGISSKIFGSISDSTVTATADGTTGFIIAESSTVTLGGINAFASVFARTSSIVNMTGEGSFGTALIDDHSSLVLSESGAFGGGIITGGSLLQVGGQGGWGYGFVEDGGTLLVMGAGSTVNARVTNGRTAQTTDDGGHVWGTADGADLNAIGQNVFTVGKDFTNSTEDSFEVGFGQADFHVESGLVNVLGDFNVAGMSDFFGDVQIFEKLFDGGNSEGNPGDILFSTGSAIEWRTPLSQGYAKIADSIQLTNQNANISSTNFSNTSTAGLYRVSYTLEDTTSDVTAGAVTLTFAYTDGAGAATLASAAVPLTGLGIVRTQGVIFIQLASGSISYSTSHTGAFGTSKYAVYAIVERMV